MDIEETHNLSRRKSSRRMVTMSPREGMIFQEEPATGKRGFDEGDTKQEDKHIIKVGRVTPRNPPFGMFLPQNKNVENIHQGTIAMNEEKLKVDTANVSDDETRIYDGDEDTDITLSNPRQLERTTSHGSNISDITTATQLEDTQQEESPQDKEHRQLLSIIDESLRISDDGELIYKLSLIHI